ncbi:MAG: dockerin type I domain-containing protein [Phycisphaerae bacterium]
MHITVTSQPRFRDLLLGTTLAVTTLTASAAVIEQNFNTVTGSGGGTFFTGPGFGEVAGWDTGILGENAFAGTTGNARIAAANALGSTNAGVGGSGAGVISINGVTFDVISQNFNAVTGTGGGAFLLGNGSADTNGFAGGWDLGITGEQAFGGTGGGAVLNGSMSAIGVIAGGGIGRLDVDNVSVNAGNWYAGLQFPIGALPGAFSLANPSFDAGGVATLGSWQIFSAGFNVLAAPATGGAPVVFPRTGNGVLKMFGRFTGGFNVSGVYQEFTAQPNQTWEIDVWSRHNADDDIGGTQNFAVMRIEFFNGTTLISGQEVIVCNASSPLDTWIDNVPLQVVAPATTTSARGILSFVQPGVGTFEGGAVQMDDAKFRLVSGPGAFSLAGNSLTARVRGAVNAGAGESLGTVQLRIEDPDGNRLVFNQLATTGFQNIGGALSTFSEQNAQGVPTPGAFDPGAATHNVIVAFNNDATAWGSGGTLDVDDLALSNSNPAGSAWYAGLYFDDLSVPNGTTLDDLELFADIKGSVPGGNYQLRLEAFNLGSAGLDEDFETATGTNGGTFLSAEAVAGGATNGFDDNWDDGITGEGAFGGVFGLVEVFPGGGFTAEGLTVGGFNSSGAGEISVLDIIVGPGGGWYGGLSWGGQALASTDLSQVVLSANVRGIAQPGGGLGVYELRIEDAQGDRLYFRNIADGNWQNIGGPLSTATEGPRLGGGGDGNFDVDSPTYTIALSFIDPESTWFFGGTLQIDNLFLTPVQTREEVGRVTFRGTSNGAFQTIGGLLSEGETNLGDYEQDFSGAAATGGTPTDWDANLTGETSFFGTFGGAVANGGATASACATCGVGGSKAAQIDVLDVPPGAGGGWFAGLVFTNIPSNLSGDLSTLQLSAQIRGTADAGQGESLGTIIFRVEDADLTSLQFEVPATGGFQTVGGALSTASLVQINQGDGVFNRFQETYTITMAFVGTAGNWGSGGTLTIDNVFLSGVQLDDADEYTVTVTFEDEIVTWGNAGTLTVDNLSLAEPAAACPGDLNGDNAVNLTDLATLLANFGTGSGATLAQGDIDGDGDVDLTDLATLLANFGTVC